MNESDLDFVNWWWLEQERQRLARSGRVRQTRLELAELLLTSQACLRAAEAELQRRRRPLPKRPESKQDWKTGPWQASAFVRSLGADKPFFRTMSFDRESAVVSDKTLDLTVSSDVPLERSYGFEILDHSPGSILLDRFEKAAPLLFNHDPNAHIGRIVYARTDGKKLSVRAKFSNSALAKEKYQDVKDGILRDASLGYAILQMEEGPRGTFRATQWRPYESSLVTIPADTSVGVGRSL